MKAYRKRKAELEPEKSAKNPREDQEHEGTSFITFFQEFGNQVAQEESDYEIHALVVNNVKEMEAEPQPLQELFNALQQKEETRAQEYRGMTCQRVQTKGKREVIHSENTPIKYWYQKHKKNEHELTMLLECGSPSTIIGIEDFKQILRQYNPMIQTELEYRQSNKHYEFGGGRRTHSLGKVCRPM